MFCSQCGSRIPENSHFCGSCGERITQRQGSYVTSVNSSSYSALVCTQCGSNKLVKNDNVYICPSCGTRYTIDDNRQVLVSVSGGTVRIDNYDNLENLVHLACNEINSGNGEKALSLSDRALEIKYDYLRAWYMKTLATALLSDTNKVVSCLESIDNYCIIRNKDALFTDLFLGCFHAYMSRMEALLDQYANKTVADCMNNLEEIQVVAGKLLALVLKLDKKQCNIPNDTANYVFDYLSRLNSLNAMCYFISKSSLLYLQAIDRIGGICKLFLEIARYGECPYFEEGMRYMIKCVYTIDWSGKILQECKNDSKLNKLYTTLKNQREYYTDRF